MASNVSPRNDLFADLEARVRADARLSEERRDLLGRTVMRVRSEIGNATTLYRLAVVADLAAFCEAVAAGADPGGWRGIGSELNRVLARDRSTQVRGTPRTRKPGRGLWQQDNNDNAGDDRQGEGDDT